MRLIPRFLNLLAITALLSGVGMSATQTMTLASLTAPGSTVVDRPVELHQAAATAHNVYQTADAGIQLIMGILLIVLGFFLHALARMQNGERPVHITVKPKKRQMWFWVDMKI